MPVTFAGQSTVTIPSGGMVVSDPLEIDVPQGTNMFALTYVSVESAGMKWPLVKYGIPANQKGNRPSADDTGSTTGLTVATSNGYLYGPTMVLGEPHRGARAARLLLIGDSIMRGATNTTDTGGINVLAPLSQTMAHNIAAYGETTQAFGTIAGHRFRGPLAEGCTAWLSGYGANDVKVNGQTLASIAASLLKVWAVAYERTGVPGYQWTITPQATSTDSFATTGNQTVAAAPYSNTTRTAVNDWLRDGAPILNGVAVATGSSAVGTLRAGGDGHPLAGYFDIADAVETARNSGTWKANGGTGASAFTFDGIHPGDAGYAAMNAAIDWAELGAA